MTFRTVLVVLALTSANAFAPTPLTHSRGRPQTQLHESLAQGLLRQVTGGIFEKGGVLGNIMGEDEKPIAEGEVRSSDVLAGREDAAKKRDVVAGIDSRAQTGSVTFDDFLEMGRLFKQTGGKMPGMPGTLTKPQVEETLAKFALHEKIVEVMLPEERANPQLLMDDLKNIADDNAPRVQRLAMAAKVEEKDVAMFAAEFEAMRQSTQRIAAGEDPDAVNKDIGGSNRSERRALKKAQAGGKLNKQFKKKKSKK